MVISALSSWFLKHIRLTFVAKIKLAAMSGETYSPFLGVKHCSLANFEVALMDFTQGVSSPWITWGDFWNKNEFEFLNFGSWRLFHPEICTAMLKLFIDESFDQYWKIFAWFFSRSLTTLFLLTFLLVYRLWQFQFLKFESFHFMSSIFWFC